MEFTVERGKLYMLQTRSGKRTGRAAVKIEKDMEAEGLITRDEALLRVGEFDLISIATPIGLHYEQGRQAVVSVLLALSARIDAQDAQIAKLVARVEELERRLNRNSRNSSADANSST